MSPTTKKIIVGIVTANVLAAAMTGLLWFIFTDPSWLLVFGVMAGSLLNLTLPNSKVRLVAERNHAQ